MKLFVTYLFIATYSLGLVGIPVHKHFCRGELKHFSLFKRSTCHAVQEVPFSCCMQKTEESDACQKDACCDDESALLMNTIDQLLQHGSDSKKVLKHVARAGSSEGCRLGMIAGYSDSSLRTHPPPPWNTNIYLLNCALIFYG